MNTESILIEQTSPRPWVAGGRGRADAEFDAICKSLKQRVMEGTMPPDDAYWWTRIAACEAGVPDPRASAVLVPFAHHFAPSLSGA